MAEEKGKPDDQNSGASDDKNKKVLTPFVALKDFLSRDEFKTQISLALPKHLTADRMLRVALTAALHQPKIADVVMTAPGKASLMKALLTASQLGLEVDGRQGHLIPFNDKRFGMVIQFIPGYQGLVQLGYNHPKVKSIWWAVVHQNDEFVYEDGLDRKLLHRRYSGDGEPGPLTHAYAVCEMEGGAKTFVCLNKREVEKAKKSSRSATSEYSPWTTHPEAMWAKTAVRALSKQMPQSNELRAALQVDDEVDALTDDERFAAAKSLTPTFGTGLPGADDGKGDDEKGDGAPPAGEKRGRGRPKKTVDTPTSGGNPGDPPPRATPLEGLRNIMSTNNPPIEEKDLLAYLFGIQKVEQGDTLETIGDDRIKMIIEQWPLIAPNVGK